jgi:dipeptidyl aminopeptidase/acylaminoacyl peptidase
MLSYLNDSIDMDQENAIKNSPVFLRPAYDCPLLLVTGTEETDEFKAQTEELYNCWKNQCSQLEFLEVPQKNHYSILDAVIEKDSILRAAILRLMNIDPETALVSRL